MKKFLRLLFVLIIACTTFTSEVPVKASNTWFVEPGGLGTACTQANPCDLDTCVQTIASSNDTIFAKEGTYTATDSTSHYVTYISKSLTIIGSCQYGSTGLVTCDITKKTSILDGQTARRGIAIQGFSNDGMHVYIAGFTIMRGDAYQMGPSNCIDTYAGPVNACGGGIYSENVDELTLQHIDFWANTASSSMDPDHNSLGGALYVDNTKNLTLLDNLFRYNYAANQGYGYGGVMFISNSGDPGGILLNNNVIYNNETGYNRVGQAAGLFSYNNNGLHLLGNEFEYQNAFQQLLVPGSAIMIRGSNTLTFSQNSFKNNEGDSTIAIIGDMGNISGRIERNKFWGNPTELLFDIFGNITMDFVNNFIGRLPDIKGSTKILLNLEGSPAFDEQNISIIHNSFAEAGYGVKANDYTTVNIRRNIFAYLHNSAINIPDPAMTSSTILENLFYANNNDGRLGSTFFRGDPFFTDKDSGDFHLQPGSEAINKVTAGSVLIDIDGEVRPFGVAPNNVDLGADEFHAKLFLPLILK